MKRKISEEILLRAAGVVYAFLPFKAAVWFGLRLRRRYPEDIYNEYFKIFCIPGIEEDMDWFLHGNLSKKFLSEILYFLNLYGWQKLVLAQFHRLNWSDRRGFFANSLAALIERFESGYAMDVIVRFHQIKWKGQPAEVNLLLTTLVRRMLEHRLFQLEERMIFEKKSFKGLALPISTEIHVPFFYRNKELILRLSQELGLGETAPILEQLDLDGQLWEDFPYDGDDKAVIQDIHLFYAYRDLTLYSYHNGEGQLVGLLCERMFEVQQRLIPHLPSPSAELRALLDSLGIDNLSDVKLMWPDWAVLIGHNGHLNVHLMMREMGWWKGKPIVLAWKERIANPVFLSLFEDICPVLILDENVSSAVWHELASLVPFVGVSHQTFRFDDGRCMYWNDAGGLAVAEWEASERGYPLRDIYDRRLTAEPAPEVSFQTLRQKWGMNPSDWYVCLHMRDGATRDEKDGTGETIRNTSMDNYLDAIRYVTDQGGWVIRMGGPKVPPLPPMERVVDYARSGDASAQMDIHLMRNAKMFIGTTSGFAYVASSFGIPTAMVNALSSVGLIWTNNTRFALKHVRDRSGRLLTQREVTSEKWRWAFPTHESLTHAGLTVEESSADEILETVKETLALAMGSPPPADLTLRAAWSRSVQVPGFYGAGLPGDYFLRKHATEFLADA